MCLCGDHDQGVLGEGTHYSNASVCTSQGISAQLREIIEAFWAHFLVLWRSEEKRALKYPHSASTGRHWVVSWPAKVGNTPTNSPDSCLEQKKAELLDPVKLQGHNLASNQQGFLNLLLVQPSLLQEAELKGTDDGDFNLFTGQSLWIYPCWLFL